MWFTDLKILVKVCVYQEQEDSMVRDATVFSCKYTNVHPKCLHLTDELIRESCRNCSQPWNKSKRSKKKVAKRWNPTVDVVSKEKRETRSRNRRQIKAQTRKTLKKKKARKDQTRKTSAGGKVTTKPTRNVQQWDNCALSAKRWMIIPSSVDQNKCVN